MNALFHYIKQVHQYTGKALYINLFAMGLNGLLASMGVLLLVPLINMTGMIDMGAEENPLLNIFSFISQFPPSIGFPLVLMFYVIFITVQNVVGRKIQLRNSRIQFGFLRHMQIQTFHSLLFAKWNFFIHKRKSDLINILTTEVAKSSLGALSFLQFMSSLVFSGIQILLAFFLSPFITLFVLGSGSILILFNRKFLRHSYSIGNMNLNLGKEYLAGITDQMNGIKDIKSNTLEESGLHWYQSITKAMMDRQVEHRILISKTNLYYKISSAMFMAVFIYVSVNLFSAQAGQLMLIIIIFGRLWPTVSGIQSSLEQIATLLPSLKAVIKIQEESRLAQEFELDKQTEYKPLAIHESIECYGVYFKYDSKSPNYALKNINLVIPANQMTAIVGPSGAGKSTLIDMLMGLNQPEEGQVLLDGIALTEERLVSLRKAVSYVPQDPYLFNGSIRDNLLLANRKATEEQIWEALGFSSVAEFVKKLPEGLDTLIGDRGVKLSGGERQRLVLARAILRNPSILILDEATSALDSENEAMIQKSLEGLKGKMTIIVIAHRLSTIRNADQVVVLENGEIIQQGSYDQLTLDRRGMFLKLVSRQLEGVL